MDEAKTEIDNLPFSSCVFFSGQTDVHSIFGLLEHSGWHCTVIICEESDGAEQDEIKRLSSENLLDHKTVYEVTPGSFVVTHDAFCSHVEVLGDAMGISTYGFTFGVAKVFLKDQPAIVIGLLNSPLSLEDPPKEVLDSMGSVIERYNVRILTGVFPNCDDTSLLAKLCIQNGAVWPPLRQCVWEDECKYAWPHQVVLFGPIKEVSAVADDDLKTWEDMKERFGRTPDFVERLHDQMCLVNTPSQRKPDFAKNLNQAMIAATKPKPIDWSWWLVGAHQICLWIDGRRSRRGSGSAAKQKEVRFVRKKAKTGQ